MAGEADPAAVAAFTGYLLVVIALGLATARFSSGGLSEYFLAGRGVNRFVVALSAVVSGRSAWLLLGFTGMAYERGVSAVWAVVGYILVEMLLFLFYAGRLRRFSEHRDCITLPDFFAERFDDVRGVLRSLVAIVILVFMITYVAAQFEAGGKAFAASFGMDQRAGVILTAGIVLVYTILGGFLAVSLTDMIQALFMLFALVALPFIVIAQMGGAGSLHGLLAALDPGLVDPLALSVGALVGFLGIGLGSPGNPHILVRYMSIRDARQLPAAALVGTIWNVLMAWGALLVGLAGRVRFPRAGDLPGGDPEKLLPVLAAETFHPAIFGLVVAAIFAAIMSTADSQLLVAASTLVGDVYQRVLGRGKGLSARRLVLLSRAVVLALVLIALLLAFTAGQVVFWFVLFAWAGLGAALGPTSILALAWKRATLPGVASGLIAGGAVTILWNRTPALKGLLYELIPAFAAGLIVTVLVSLVTRPPRNVDEAFRVMAGGGPGRTG